MNENIEKLADQFVQRISEWDDRTSPSDWPEALLITGEELKRELLSFLAEANHHTAETSPVPVSQGALDILQERARQHQREGFSLDHDVSLNEHGTLALAGAAYAIHAADPIAQIDIKVGVRGWLRNGGWCGLASLVWPKSFDRAKWWKPGSGISEYDPRRCLVKACALILAEIDRYDRERDIKAAEAKANEAQS